MADETDRPFVVEQQFPSEETWALASVDGEPTEYATEAEAEAAKKILASIYRRMSWRVVDTR